MTVISRWSLMMNQVQMTFLYCWIATWCLAVDVNSTVQLCRHCYYNVNSIRMRCIVVLFFSSWHLSQLWPVSAPNKHDRLFMITLWSCMLLGYNFIYAVSQIQICTKKHSSNLYLRSVMNLSAILCNNLLYIYDMSLRYVIFTSSLHFMKINKLP